MELTVKEVQETVSKLNMILLLALGVAVVLIGIQAPIEMSEGVEASLFFMSAWAVSSATLAMIMRTIMQKEHRRLNAQAQ